MGKTELPKAVEIASSLKVQLDWRIFDRENIEAALFESADLFRRQIEIAPPLIRIENHPHFRPRLPPNFIGPGSDIIMLIAFKFDAIKPPRLSLRRLAARIDRRPPPCPHAAFHPIPASPAEQLMHRNTERFADQVINEQLKPVVFPILRKLQIRPSHLKQIPPDQPLCIAAKMIEIHHAMCLADPNQSIGRASAQNIFGYLSQPIGALIDGAAEGRRVRPIILNARRHDAVRPSRNDDGGGDDLGQLAGFHLVIFIPQRSRFIKTARSVRDVRRCAQLRSFFRP